MTISRLLLFGATGDLAGRYLIPALAALRAEGRLPDDFVLVGAAQEDWDDDAFRRHATERLGQHAGDVPQADRDALVAALRYRQVDLDDPATVAPAVAEASGGSEPVVTYLALPTQLFGATIDALAGAGLPHGSRVALEKPFGVDQASAVELNHRLEQRLGGLGPHPAFRVDHFLGLASLQNLLALRLANRLLEPVWNAENVERVDIVWDEVLALEGRAAYYDRAGALKDVVQNHLLQVLATVAMEPPASLSAEDVRDAKLTALRAVEPIPAVEMAARTRRARYGAGRVAGHAVPAYADEHGVDPAHCTETFAEVELHLDTPRWRGTPFRLRTGKALGRDRMEIVVRFRPVDHTAFGPEAGGAAPAELRIALNAPGDVTLTLTGAVPGPPARLVELDLAGRPPVTELPEYGRVLLDLLSGGSSLSVRGDAAEEAWRIMDPVLRAWADGAVPLEEYPAGSEGPA